jgi:hypothetical protein
MRMLAINIQNFRKILLITALRKREDRSDVLCKSR